MPTHDTRDEPPIAGEADLLARASETATMDAPIEAIDLTRWITTLTDEEYRGFAPGEHMGCGVSVAPDGRAMSICTETVGGQLMVQHYVGEIMTPTHCRMTSVTDAFSNSGWTTVAVTWDLEAAGAPGGTSILTNSIESRATPAFLEVLGAAGVSVSTVAAQRSSSIADHNRRETPKFAASIARLATSARRDPTIP